MRPRKKVYIQNCTGVDCGNEKTPREFGISAFWSRVIFYVLFLSFIGVSAHVLFFADYLKINSIEINGTQELSAQELQQKIQNSLDGKYFNFVPKNNFLFVSQKRMENFLMGDYKKIRSVSVTKKFPNSISIIIDERKALLVWCSGDKCYMLDENGTAYSEADFSSPELTQNHLLQITDNSGAAVVLGDRIIDANYEQYVTVIKDAAAKAGYELSDQYWTSSRMSEEIDVKTQQGFDLYFSTQFPLETALNNLALIVKKEISDDQKSKLAYIDLRNESKVFYKFNSDDQQQSDDQSNVQQGDSSLQPAAESEKKKERDEKKK